MDPATACRTAACEAGVIPPGAHQGIMHRRPVGFHAEINGVHPHSATSMGTAGLRVDDVRRHLTFPAALSVDGVHSIQFFGGRSSALRQSLRHHVHSLAFDLYSTATTKILEEPGPGWCLGRAS